MVVLRGGAVSYERGTPVGAARGGRRWTRSGELEVGSDELGVGSGKQGVMREGCLNLETEDALGAQDAMRNRKRGW